MLADLGSKLTDALRKVRGAARGHPRARTLSARVCGARRWASRPRLTRPRWKLVLRKSPRRCWRCAQPGLALARAAARRV